MKTPISDFTICVKLYIHFIRSAVIFWHLNEECSKKISDVLARPNNISPVLLGQHFNASPKQTDKYISRLYVYQF